MLGEQEHDIWWCKLRRLIHEAAVRTCSKLKHGGAIMLLVVQR